MVLTLMDYHMEKEFSGQKTKSILVNGIKERKYLKISIFKSMELDGIKGLILIIIQDNGKMEDAQDFVFILMEICITDY